MTAALALVPAAMSLAAHLQQYLPDADVRVIRIDGRGLRVQVGPEKGIPTDVEIRPHLMHVATTIDPCARFTYVAGARNDTYRWLCSYEGVDVTVCGEGRDMTDTRIAPKPLPEPRGVAA